MNGSSDLLGFDFESWQKRVFEYKLTGKNRPPHPTVEMMWLSFSNSLPKELHPQHLQFIKQAFYGSLLGFYFLLDKVSETWDSDESEAIFNKLHAECQAFMAECAKAAGITDMETSRIIQ